MPGALTGKRENGRSNMNLIVVNEINRKNGLSGIFLYNVPAGKPSVPGLLRTDACAAAGTSRGEANITASNHGNSGLDAYL